MTSTRFVYVIVDDFDEIWIETISSNRSLCWKKLAKICAVPKRELIKRGFKSVPANIETAEYKQS